MLKKSPILFALAVFVLAVGWPITPVQAHCKAKGPHSGDHPHCSNGGAGPTDGSSYAVTMIGDLSFGDDPMSGLPISWVGRDGGGRSKPVHVSFQAVDMGLVNFFFNKFDSQNSTNCFGNAPVIGKTIAMTISKENDDSAYLQYWFTGHDEEGLEGGTEIQYLLEMLDGDFMGAPWRPTTAGMPTTATFTSWEMSINGNNELACTGTGEFFGVMVGVEPTP